MIAGRSCSTVRVGLSTICSAAGSVTFTTPAAPSSFVASGPCTILAPPSTLLTIVSFASSSGSLGPRRSSSTHTIRVVVEKSYHSA